MQEVMPKPFTITHLNGLVQERGVGEIVPVDLIGRGVYVDSSHYLARYATLWKKKKTDYKPQIKEFLILIQLLLITCF